MDKDEFLLIPQEQRNQILRTLHTFVESIEEAFRCLADLLAPGIKYIVDGLAKLLDPSDDVLRRYASPKEWAIYNRTKKRRIKKKYRDRFIRRAWAGQLEERSNAEEKV